MTKKVKSDSYQAALLVARKEVILLRRESNKLKSELAIANKKLLLERAKNIKRKAELGSAKKEKVLRETELTVANKEKGKRAEELNSANKAIVLYDQEKEERAAELVVANKELSFQNAEKIKRALELTKLSSVYRMLYNTVADVIYVISLEGERYRISSVNKSFETVTGIPMEKVVGKYADDITKRTGVVFNFAKYREAIASRRMVTWEETSNYPGGIFIGEVSILPIFDEKDENCLSLIGNVHNITDRKRIEAEIKQINEGLDQKVTERTSRIKKINKNLKAAKIKAEKATHIAEGAVKSKQQFLSNMSHEIRTPMNAIIGFTKVVLKTKLSAKQKEYLTAIKISGDALILLINDILDLAKVDSGKMTFEQHRFKIIPSISATIHLFESKILEKNLVVVTDFDKRIPGFVVGDQLRLNQILLNLISNAVKFTSRGKILIRVRLVSQDNEKVKIEFNVSDTGIGISEGNLEKVFETFGQASSETSRLYGGTGLGLAIVKRLVESQGGRIQVKSKVKKGSTFSFTLNFRKSKEGDEIVEEIAETIENVKDIKVLVVEDMHLNQLLMKTILDDFGFENDMASNGKVAIKKLAAKSYDIILMDLQMPQMNGFETTRYIRQKLKSKVPIIALTADVTTVDLAKCKTEGMDDYLAKPVDAGILYNRIMLLTKKDSKQAIVTGQTAVKETQSKKKKCVDLSYLNLLTKSDSRLMLKMISTYMEETLHLISLMKQSLYSEDWHLLQQAVHKMIPTFDVMGIDKSFKFMAKKINYCLRTQQTQEIGSLVLEIEAICSQACTELILESNKIKKAALKKVDLLA